MKLRKFIKEKFWILYFAAICLVFIWQLFTCGVTAFNTDTLGVSADEEYEILDEHMLETVFRVGKDAPKGFIIYSLQSNSIEFTDEKLILTFSDEESGRIIQQTEISMANQVSNLYVLFEEEIPAGTYLRLRIQSEGFEKDGPFIYLSDTEGLGNALWENGELLNTYLCGALCYETVSYNFMKPIMYFVAEVIIGIILLLAAKKMKLPFYIRRKKNIPKLRKSNWKKAIVVMGLVCILAIVFFDYVYTYTIEEAIDKRDYSVICEGGKTGEQQLSLGEGEEISQIFSVKGNNFSGIGLNIQESENANGVLRCSLYDLASGELLVEKAYEISSLKKLTEYVESEKIKTYDTDIIKQYVALDWQGVLEDSQENFYRLVIKGENLSDEEIYLALSEGDNFSVMKNGRTVNGNLCMVSLYSNDLFLKTMFRWGEVIVILLLVMFSGYLCICSMTTEKAFAVNALVLGLIFCFLIPPYCVPDEWTHFDGAYRISNEMLRISDIPGPNQIYKRACDILGESYETLSVTQEEYRAVYEGLWQVADDETLISGYAGNPVVNVTVFNYLPAALGFTVARLMHMGHMGMLLFGRIFNLLTIIILMYIAIRKIPFGKSVLAVVGLLPITLQQMASCSYDGMIIGLANIFVAYCLYIAFEERISILDIAVMGISGCMLTTCKGGVYTPILGLILIIPFTRKVVVKKYLLGFIGIVFSMFLVFVAQFSETIVSLLSRAQGTAFRSGGVELYTVSYFLQYPKEFIRIFQNTISTTGDFYVQGFLGGALGIMNINLPWFLLISFLVLILFCTFKNAGEKEYFNNGQRVFIALLCLASIFLVMFSMLLAWTAVGSTSIQGVQGRYFIPIIGLIFIIMRGNVSIKNKRGDTLVLVAGVLDMLAMGFALLSIF